jgi:predicted hotdog family 3-hydroxylacyl-ACP dehydratase
MSLRPGTQAQTPVPPQLDRDWIAARIPHAGSMCLLDRVADWNETWIRCESASHLDADHPLRAHGRLPALSAIEYAAQAMAVHGALIHGAGDPAQGSSHPPSGEPPAKPRVGYLASVRKVAVHTARLDAWPAPLNIEATRVSGDASLVLYDFAVSAGQQRLVSGRAAVVLDASA